MKKMNIFWVITVVCLISQYAYTQKIGDLKGIYYQAVAIDEYGKEIVGMDINGKPLYEKAIGVKFTITKGLDGPVLWEETHTTTTDKYGLFSLVIGTGQPTGNGMYTRLLDIPWIDADQFLKVEISTKNDGVYKLVSNQQFMAVPYSFYTDDIADNAITTEKILDSAIINRDIHTSAVDSRTILDSTIQNDDIANGTIDLTQKVKNLLPVANGGTGVSSTPSGGILLGGGGTNPIRALPQATDGQIPIGVTGGDPVLDTLKAGPGIVITNAPGSITISSGIKGVNGQIAGNVVVNTIPAGGTFISPDIPVPGVDFGDIVVASCNVDMKGCILSAYVKSPNGIKVAIFNGTGLPVNLGTVALKVLVVH